MFIDELRKESNQDFRELEELNLITNLFSPEWDEINDLRFKTDIKI